MGHVRGAALLAVMAFAVAAPVRAISLDTEAGSTGRTGFVDDSVVGKLTLRGLTGATLRIAESARIAEEIRQSFRVGSASNLGDENVMRSMPSLGAKRMLELRTNLPQHHLSARKLASIGGMGANPGNPHRAMNMVAGSIASELGLHFIARPMGQEMRLAPWSNKHGNGLSATFAF